VARVARRTVIRISSIDANPSSRTITTGTSAEATEQRLLWLGLFVRSLVGLDRGAAKEAFAEFLAGKTLGANQIQFVDMVINHLTEHGVMSAALLYESPFTDLSPHGPDGLFTSDEVDALVAVLDHVRAAAVAAA
jgi:type I restriction enzyme, R subunit